MAGCLEDPTGKNNHDVIASIPEYLNVIGFNTSVM